jgi:hypothetical protein
VRVRFARSAKANDALALLYDTVLHGVSLGGTLGLAGASLRGSSLSDTYLLADALLRGVSLSGTLLLAVGAAYGTFEFRYTKSLLKRRESAAKKKLAHAISSHFSSGSEVGQVVASPQRFLLCV